eukprot:858141-Rhodomonas_salina.3
MAEESGTTLRFANITIGRTGGQAGERPWEGWRGGAGWGCTGWRQQVPIELGWQAMRIPITYEFGRTRI